jgi:hypothetical protein
MIKQLLNSLSLFVFGALMLTMTQEAIAEPEIIGAPKCKSCHKAKTGDQWKIWTESAHANAFKTLASEESRKIAADKGLGDPQQEEACLRCHATRASLGAKAVVSDKANYGDSEGVGCESCHGPGSDYKPKKIMQDPEAARDAGLVMTKTADGCTNCHNEESPTFKGFEFEARWLDIAHPIPGAEAVVETKDSQSLADAGTPEEVLYESSVGYVIFPHDLHVTSVDLECVDCHHQIHAMNLDTPHPDYLDSSWINCQACHNPESETDNTYYKCSDCHHTNLNNIADETLSSKVVIHKNCWSCHDTGTGVEASKGCVDCHVKEEKLSNPRNTE